MRFLQLLAGREGGSAGIDVRVLFFIREEPRPCYAIGTQNFNASA